MKKLVAFLALLGSLSSEAFASSPECLGVAIHTQNGEANLMWIEVHGDSASLSKLASSALLIGILQKEINSSEQGKITISFVSPRVRASDAVSLINRAKSGEFGSLTVDPVVMGIETLPIDKCPRS